MVALFYTTCCWGVAIHSVPQTTLGSRDRIHDTGNQDTVIPTANVIVITSHFPEPYLIFVELKKRCLERELDCILNTSHQA